MDYLLSCKSSQRETWLSRAEVDNDLTKIQQMPLFVFFSFSNDWNGPPGAIVQNESMKAVSDARHVREKLDKQVRFSISQ
ncbi:hypothetical protein TNCV_4263451 [Trichonephila clavipes]|nr:hypothetical protein TNCV_4263451 [Trichonephila clavipes]